MTKKTLHVIGQNLVCGLNAFKAPPTQRSPTTFLYLQQKNRKPNSYKQAKYNLRQIQLSQQSSPRSKATSQCVWNWALAMFVDDSLTPSAVHYLCSFIIIIYYTICYHCVLSHCRVMAWPSSKTLKNLAKDKSLHDKWYTQYCSIVKSQYIC